MSYTYTDIKARLNSRMHGKIGVVSSDIRTIINDAVDEVHSEVDLRSSKRRLGIPKAIYSGIYTFAAPTDLKTQALIDTPYLNQSNYESVLTTLEEFDRRKDDSDFLIAIEETDQLKKLYINEFGDALQIEVNSCDTYNGNGTFSASADATNVRTDTLNYLEGTGSVMFDTNTGATTAVLTNSSFTTIDLTAYVTSGSIFTALYIPSSTAATAVSNFILKIGTDASNYYSKTITTTHEALAFQAGWNMLRFDLSGATETGTVTDTSIGYLQLTITKTAALAATTEWRIDRITANTGIVRDILYYSNYYWKTSAGVRLRQSTTDSDILICDEDELYLFLDKCSIALSSDLRESDDYNTYNSAYDKKKENYCLKYKSERKRTNTTYWKFNNP